MKTRKKTILIIHESNTNIDYYDDEKVRLDISSFEAMALIIAQFAAQLQHSDDENESCVYKIDITKSK